ncbi:uncharacterized protein LOC143356342 [Halictus rubicundus]|uniref:uncharacterized protein LOC143356342 n=1 Tax=Halictus rubicundus TaxID=77578 RepID=UPI0040373509
MGSFRIRILLGLVALSLGHVSGAADTDTIFFRHYSGGSHRDVNIKQIAKLIPQLNLNECTIFYVHGFMDSVDGQSATTIADAYLNRTSCNVIAIDYRQIADNINYIADALHVDDVGGAIGNGLNQLVDHGLNPDKIHIIGHSLGAQVAGHVGSHTKFVIPRITGLDPAGPLFYTGRYLKSGNAKFVDIIHTDAGFAGQIYSSADSDFYPNDGHEPQPGCPLVNPKEVGCSHSRSWMYYAESVLNPDGFMAIQCTGSWQFKTGTCNRANVVPMGYATPTTARGKFYLHTNSQSPFAKGLQGIYMENNVVRSTLHGIRPASLNVRVDVTARAKAFVANGGDQKLNSCACSLIIKMTEGRILVVAVAACCLIAHATAQLSWPLNTIRLRHYSEDLTYKEYTAEEGALIVPFLDLSNKTLLHCHGYLQSTDDPDVVVLITDYVRSSGYDIIAADYRSVTYSMYPTAAMLARAVADTLRKFVEDMVSAGVNPNSVVLSGFSLGAQIAGNMGRNMSFQVQELIGLDAAGPLYDDGTLPSLSASDAACVKCIHTDGGGYGTANTCGHQDFYPNGGERFQPGCPIVSVTDILQICSHIRGEYIGGESARNPNAFLSIECNSWDDFKVGNCNSNNIVPMGVGAPCSP